MNEPRHRPAFVPRGLARIVALLGLSATVAVGLGGCALFQTEPLPIRLVAFNDFHGHLQADGLTLTLADPAQPGARLQVPTGGAAALAGMVKKLREGSANTVVISSGDMVGATPLVSAFFRHESTVEAMNLLGVDVAVAGNHEFDAGQVELKRLLQGGCLRLPADAPTASCALHPYKGARFPMVAANVEVAADQGLFAPAWVATYGAVKVGVIGAVTRSTPSIVLPHGVAGLRFLDEADAINRTARQLKAQGVQVLVASVHEGGAVGSREAPVDWNDESCPAARGEIFELAKRITPEVSVIFSAHTHQGYRCRVDGRLILQAVSYGRGLSVVDLKVHPRSGVVDWQRSSSRNLPVLNDRTEPALRERLAAAEAAPWAAVLREAQSLPAMTALVDDYARAAAPRAQREVARIGAGFDRRGRADANAGRLIADAQLAATRDRSRGGAQLALMNPGGIRADLPCSGTPPCAVTYGDLFLMQPFGNSLVVMTLSGAELLALLESQQPPGRASPLFLAPSEGLSYRWVASVAAGQRVQGLSLDGEPVQPTRNYRVAVNSFLAEGGDGFALLRHGRDRLGGAQDLDALISYLQTPASLLQTTPRIVLVD